MAAKTLFSLALAFAAVVNGQSITISNFNDVASAKASYTSITISSMAVPAGKTLDLTGLKTGTTVTFTGTTTFAYSEWVGPLVSVSGTDITVTGSGTLDGKGASYWDGNGGSGGVKKPKFFQAHNLNGKSKITGITILNSPVQAWSVGSSTGLTISGVTLNNKAGTALGKNTDAFDIGSVDQLTITGATVYNQDDCVAINSGTNIVISNMNCNGGHGLSIGSVGGRDDNTVQNVQIKDSTVTNSAIGVRIKTNVGTTGLVDKVTYSNIKLSGITKYGVILEQDYNGGDAKGTPDNGVPITNLVLSGVTGSVTSAGLDFYIECGSGSCSNWTFTNVAVTGGGKASKCNYTPSGFTCK
ncbi:hypothetical protein VE02_03353 [Pseudogymnoascus sp. 03VT05]|nr:hypothetical protein VE02_03353 [Pseudogymnoascus sp. 03VT05]